MSKIKELIASMEKNTFLLPDGWGNNVKMSAEIWEYRTYVGDRGKSRYIHIEIHEFGKIVIDFKFNGDDLIVSKDITNNLTVPQLEEYIQKIYDEMHSFSLYDEETVKLIEEISTLGKKMKEDKIKYTKLTKQLSDSKKLLKKKA